MCWRNGRSEGIQRACLVSFLIKICQETAYISGGSWNGIVQHTTQPTYGIVSCRMGLLGLSRLQQKLSRELLKNFPETGHISNRGTVSIGTSLGLKNWIWSLLVSPPAYKVKEIRAEAIRVSNMVSLSARLLSNFWGSSAQQSRLFLQPCYSIYHCLQRNSQQQQSELRGFLSPYCNPPEKNSPGGENTFANGIGSL